MSFFPASSRRGTKTGRGKRIEAVSKAAGDPVTGRSVTEAYILEREKVERARGARLDAGNRMRKHILSDAAIADKELHCLTEADLQDWRGRLPADFARATVLRVNNDFKAALNAGVSKHARRLQSLNASHIGVIVKNGLAATDAVSPVARDKIIRTADPHASGRLWLSGTTHLSGDEPRIESVASTRLH
ncbi:hypothetical protein [Mesorhizobium sp. M0590]|uniref:hypothetical protein n=1 Tax=unclassified Mesorhizobium TaxID=325217 RepID=UPI003337F176